MGRGRCLAGQADGAAYPIRCAAVSYQAISKDGRGAKVSTMSFWGWLFLGVCWAIAAIMFGLTMPLSTN